MQPAGSPTESFPSPPLRKRSRPGDLHHSDAAAPDPFHHEDGEDEEDEDDEEHGGATKKDAKKAGRRKIKIEFIQDKSRRHITFSKRKAGIMKKAYELSTLTGTQVLLLVVSETGLVYTFTTAKLQPLVTQPEGKNLIQACLNAPAGTIPTGQPAAPASSSAAPPRSNRVGGLAIGSKDDEEHDDDPESPEMGPAKPRQRRRTSSAASKISTVPQPGGRKSPGPTSAEIGLGGSPPAPAAAQIPPPASQSPQSPTTQYTTQPSSASGDQSMSELYGSTHHMMGHYAHSQHMPHPSHYPQSASGGAQNGGGGGGGWPPMTMQQPMSSHGHHHTSHQPHHQPHHSHHQPTHHPHHGHVQAQLHGRR